jgi:hypothetical protein
MVNELVDTINVGGSQSVLLEVPTAGCKATLTVPMCV